MPARIVLATLNAKFIHASLGLRYLQANMQRHGSDALAQCTHLREYTIHRNPAEIVRDLLQTLEQARVRIAGFGVYIWNVTETTEVVRLLKQADPDVKVVLGGPEVSHETGQQAIVALADHVITGWGDVSFPRLCQALIDGPRPLMKVIAGLQPPLEEISLPYAGYTDADLSHRLLYVEASRGCPFRCEFCLSALDQTAWAFDLERFLAEMDRLYRRGARNFKFVDRTFNLKIESTRRILAFFLERLADRPDEPLALHFELVPDHLPERLRELLVQFPPGVLQLEIGIQSFNPEVQQRISRRQDNERTVNNLAWLRAGTQAHLHTDLIFGLPGESRDSFAQGFDRLVALDPHEIQLGVLKRLRGTPLAVKSDSDPAMDFSPGPPYTVLRTDAVTEAEVQAFTRLARYWDLIANSGRFARTLPLLLNMLPAGPEAKPAVAPTLAAKWSATGSAFSAFSDFSDWLWSTAGTTYRLTPEQLVDALFDYLTGPRGLPAEPVRAALLEDYVTSGARANPRALQGRLPRRVPAAPSALSLQRRQQRHHTEAAAPTKIGP